MDLTLAGTVFAVIFAAELPDKTMVATLVLSTRYRPLFVWLGVSTAFLLQVAIAVAAGGLLSLAPERLVAAASALLFAVGAAILLFGSEDGDEGDDEVGANGEGAHRTTASALRAVWTSFVVLFVAEWGDLSQLATAGFAARSGDPLSVFVGAFAALASVAGLAVVVGRSLLRVVPVAVFRRLAGAGMVVLAVLAAIAAVRG